MKIKHIWSILCKESVINQDDNIISIIGVLEELKTTLIPKDSKTPRPEKITIPFKFEVVNYWIREVVKEDILSIKTSIVDPEGKEISNVVNDSTFPTNFKKLRTRLKVQGLTVTKSGDYWVRISFKVDKEKDYKLVAELPLKVTITIGNSKVSS